MPIAAQDSDSKIRSMLADQGSNILFIGFSNIQKKDVYQFTNTASKKTIFSSDVIWLSKTYSQHMGIEQVYIITCAGEEEEIDEEEDTFLVEEDNAGPPAPISEDDQIKQIMDVPVATST
jgi:hypothetical protein